MTDVILAGYRYVQIQVGDTLQTIAARELGDADQWRALIEINGLTSPFITKNAAMVSPTVLGYGARLLVPAPTVQISATTDPNRVFGTDLQLINGDLVVVNGDFALVAGESNLRQALNNRLKTPLADLMFHLPYGCGINLIQGTVEGPTSGLLGARYASDALAADPRIQSVPSAVATIVGDTTSITATVVPVTGSSIDLSTQV